MSAPPMTNDPTSPLLKSIPPGFDPAVEALLDRAFGPGRRARTAYRLRGETPPDPQLSAVAIAPDSGIVIGAIICTPVALVDAAGRHHALSLVGPVAVDPDRQGTGIGASLMVHMLDGGGRDRALVLIGDADYYGRFGFSAAATAGWALPGPVERHRLLARLPDGETLPGAARLEAVASALRRAG